MFSLAGWWEGGVYVKQKIRKRLLIFQLFSFSQISFYSQPHFFFFFLAIPGSRNSTKLRLLSLPRQWSNFHYRAYICLFNFNFNLPKRACQGLGLYLISFSNQFKYSKLPSFIGISKIQGTL